MKKRYLVLLVVLVLAVALVLTLVACGSRNLAEEDTAEVEIESEEAPLASGTGSSVGYYSNAAAPSYKQPTASATPASTSTTSNVTNNTTNNTTNNASDANSSSAADTANGMLDGIMQMHKDVSNAVIEYKFAKVGNEMNTIMNGAAMGMEAISGLTK